MNNFNSNSNFAAVNKHCPLPLPIPLHLPLLINNICTRMCSRAYREHGGGGTERRT